MACTWAFDLDGSISAYPEQMKALMEGLRAQGHRVVVLSGHPAPSVDQSVLDAKRAKLESLGVDCYDELVAVSEPVPEMKAGWLSHVGAAALVDNDKKNIKAAQKVGVMGLRVK